MTKLKLNIDRILSQSKTGLSRWELDNIVWNDRASNPNTLQEFLTRITNLSELESLDTSQEQELEILIELANELDEEECIELLSNDDEVIQQHFIETLARKSAIEVLTNGRVGFETMSTTCKLSPSDFILTAKRTQDLINAIQELVIQGETLSNDVAGA
jgi:uncharacterized protein YjgD (DUF1641 family)